jgi:hypothetical protein
MRSIGLGCITQTHGVKPAAATDGASVAPSGALQSHRCSPVSSAPGWLLGTSTGSLVAGPDTAAFGASALATKRNVASGPAGPGSRAFRVSGAIRAWSRGRSKAGPSGGSDRRGSWLIAWHRAGRRTACGSPRGGSRPASGQLATSTIGPDPSASGRLARGAGGVQRRGPWSRVARCEPPRSGR